MFPLLQVNSSRVFKLWWRYHCWFRPPLPTLPREKWDTFHHLDLFKRSVMSAYSLLLIIQTQFENFTPVQATTLIHTRPPTPHGVFLFITGSFSSLNVNVVRPRLCLNFKSSLVKPQFRMAYRLVVTSHSVRLSIQLPTICYQRQYCQNIIQWKAGFNTTHESSISKKSIFVFNQNKPEFPTWVTHCVCVCVIIHLAFNYISKDNILKTLSSKR